MGAAGGPAAFGALYAQPGYGTAWLAVAAMTLLAAAVIWLAARADAMRAHFIGGLTFLVRV